MQSMSELVGISIIVQVWKQLTRHLGSAIQHYSDRQLENVFYEPSPYSAFLAFVHDCWHNPKPSFVEWIATLSFHGSYEKLTSAGRQLFQTFQSKLKGPKVFDTRYARWVNSYPPSCHQTLSSHSSKTWKLVDSILDSSLSSRGSEATPDIETWLAAVTWTACIHDQSMGVGQRVARLNEQVEAMIEKLHSTLLLLLHPPNTDAVQGFRCKIENSSHTCWGKHDPAWYASAISYLHGDDDPEFVPYGARNTTCKGCILVEHAHKFATAISGSSDPGDDLYRRLCEMVSKLQCAWLDN